MNAVISTEVDEIEDLKKQLAQFPDMKGMELASKVSTKEPTITVTKMQAIKFQL